MYFIFIFIFLKYFKRNNTNTNSFSSRTLRLNRSHSQLRRSIRSLAESIDSFTLHGFVLHSDGSHSSIVLTPSYAAISIAVVLTFNRTDSLLTESIRSLAIIYQFVLHSDGSHSSIVLTRSYAALSIAVVLTFNRTDSFSLSIDRYAALCFLQVPVCE
jgi:hypothetical protein